MSGKQRRLVYGPVPSRRLGLSLGVDLVPYKVCCFNCVYCQLGPTSAPTVERGAFADPDRAARDVEQALRAGPRPDVITLAGSGEPTLHQGLERVVSALRRVTDVPICLLTNGGLLWRDDVVEAALKLDIVVPSLDAADQATFARVNRPASGLELEQVLRGLRAFCDRFDGRCQLEVMLVKGVNDATESLDALAGVAGTLGVATVDLNTVVRPPAYPGVRGLGPQELERALSRFTQTCPARIIAPFTPRDPAPADGDPEARSVRDRILDTLARRPCTPKDLSVALGLSPGAVREACEAAVESGELEEQRPDPDGDLYYVRRP